MNDRAVCATQSQRRACLPHALPLIGIHPTRLPIVRIAEYTRDDPDQVSGVD